MPVSNTAASFVTDPDGFVYIPGQLPFRTRIVVVGGKKQWKMEFKDVSDNQVRSVIDTRE